MKRNAGAPTSSPADPGFLREDQVPRYTSCQWTPPFAQDPSVASTESLQHEPTHSKERQRRAASPTYPSHSRTWHPRPSRESQRSIRTEARTNISLQSQRMLQLPGLFQLTLQGPVNRKTSIVPNNYYATRVQGHGSTKRTEKHICHMP
jgi:hypothetical protein